MTSAMVKITCPHCGREVVAKRGSAGRVLLALSLGTVLAILGGAFGAGIGIATAGLGLPATIPLAIIGFVLGACVGYIIGDKRIDLPRCPACKRPLRLSK
jgi:4-hydroxybenzoate polyprenyltransferase